ncbi:tRNA(Ser) Um(44) 2'-O-methyltransferase [Pseudocyphellaria aurata]|nr:tRNA(Ser) Um(44) 2'-O-methyltransferase [Pseudocyphellaria aurata]
MSSFKPLSHLESTSLRRLPLETWLPILQHACDFPAPIFESVALNLIRNPNINSNLLFRADILYDSCNDELTTVPSEKERLEANLRDYSIRDGDLAGFHITRTLVRLMVPRNPQLDKPIAQTCHILESSRQDEEAHLVVYIPHVSRVEDLPWYHPRVQSVAYLHTWRLQSTSTQPLNEPLASHVSQGEISLHYLLFPSETLPLSDRLLRTAHHLLSTMHKHGQGALAGYKKRVHHDQLISQQRVQDTYTELKRKHAKRLCDNWVERTEPSKHVFEDLGIAAFLIELWKDMYRISDHRVDREHEADTAPERPEFPGFVDIGCGNGVLVDVLRREGYDGWGFDARRRKTWATFEPAIQKHLKQLMLIPQPLFQTTSVNCANGGILSHKLKPSTKGSNNKKHMNDPIWHNGIFPTGTFIISNHADELTPWTPLLASISSSPFLAIPCCSHNLSGLRFRAPSVFNSYSADSLAPSYFAANISKSKAVAIKIAPPEIEDEQPASGDLNDLNAKARSKLPSAYASLCDWVSHLSGLVGYVVEKEMLRLPSTRNMGIVGRAISPEVENELSASRMESVRRIANQEGADGVAWVERIKTLAGGKEDPH